jgi:tetratricopeptide (TPR) repeat protein
MNDTNAERQVLSKLAELDADALDAFLRLTELAANAQDWPTVELNTERFLAVNPLVPQPHRYLAQASEAAGDKDGAIRAWKTLLLLDPPDPAEAHFRLARLLEESGQPGAKRHLLQALEEAPRFREAHRLLLQMNRQHQQENPSE